MSYSKISVVICTRDRSRELRKCLNSFIRIKPQPFEIVVVDQSYNGHTVKVVEECSRLLSSPVHYIHQDCIGHTKARNAGIFACSGDIIAFTDDDCIIDEKWLEALSREFEDPKVSSVCGQTKPANHQDRPKQALISTMSYRKRKVIRGRRNPLVIGKGNNMAFRRDDLLRLGGFNEQIGVGSKVYAGDDTDLFYRLLSAGGTIVKTPRALVLHGQPDDWMQVLRKKRGYSISTAAVLASRMRYGDLYAVGLLLGKIAYEFGYLLCGGTLRLNKPLMAIGWHSFLGSLSGMKYLLDSAFCEHARELSLLARESFVPVEGGGKMSECGVRNAELETVD